MLSGGLHSCGVVAWKSKSNVAWRGVIGRRRLQSLVAARQKRGTKVVSGIFVAGGLTSLGAGLARLSPPSYAALSLAASIAIFCWLAFLVRRKRNVVLAPSFISIALLTVGTTLVPLSWAAGLSDPWPELEHRLLGSVGWGIAFILLFGVGVALAGGFPPSQRSERLVIPARRLNKVLACTAVTGLLGIFLFFRSVGGPIDALDSLSTRSQSFAGTGPIIVIAFVPAGAIVYYVTSAPAVRTRGTRLLMLLNAAAFTGAAFFLGQKSHVALLLLMALVTGNRYRPVSAKVVVVLVLAAIPLSTLYHYKIRQEISTGAAEGTVATSSPLEFVRSTWDPFARSGLDYLRTLNASIVRAKAFENRVEVLVAAPFTAVPRSVWPTKPEAAAVRFSQEVFPQHWKRGTGVPPSLAGEFVWEFGVGGGMVAFLLAGVIAGRADRRFAAAASLAGRLGHAAFAAGLFIALKAGSDSAFRAFLLFGTSFLLVWLFDRLLQGGRSPRWSS